ncbi:MAG: GNAT family N-acetyltransferase [Firmicutes bacterium]|nr:GNAT family N-acetyltransferase [Bacillota bacterium]
MNKINFRKATLGDIKDIMKIEKDSFDNNIIEQEHVFKERIRIFNDGFLVATLNNKVIGYICSELWNFNDDLNIDAFRLGHSISECHINNGNELYISSMGLLKEYRGFGYGSNMFNFLINKHKSNSNKIKSVILLVSYEFKKAKQMYEKQGFRELFEVKSAFRFNSNNVQSGLVMRKILWS